MSLDYDELWRAVRLHSILAYSLRWYKLTKTYGKIIMVPRNPENSGYAYRLIRLGEDWKGFYRKKEELMKSENV